MASSRLKSPGTMEHRHLNHQGYTLAAIDDIVLRGQWADWLALGRAARSDPVILQKVKRVCAAYADDIGAQRHHFWAEYVRVQEQAS